MLALHVRSTGATASAPDASDSIYQEDWGPVRKWRRRLLSPLFRISDSGLPGLTPLRTHILICGFPRSGTTLLQMMLENAMPKARRFGREVGGWRAATYSWRNHPIVISKVPHDIFRLDGLRDFYASRPASLRIILMLRDPRDVLTSRRTTGGPKGYVVGPERWRRYYQAFLRERNDPSTLVVNYENLVRDVALHQRRIEEFTGEVMDAPMAEFQNVQRPDFDTSTLNGLRAVDQSCIARWEAPEHRQHITSMLREIPELPEALVTLGYEQDERWIDDWSNRQTTAPAHQLAESLESIE
jgi:hypothetical protein